MLHLSSIPISMIPNEAKLICRFGKEIFGGRSGIWNIGVGFDLDTPLWIEERCDNHCGGRKDFSEDFAMSAADLFPVLCMSKKHASTVDMLKAGSGLFKCSPDDVENGPGLIGG